MAETTELEMCEPRAYVGERFAAHVDPAGRVIDVLNDIQSEFGYLPEPALEQLAQLVDIATEELTAIASFFSNFSFTPTGRTLIEICDGTACHTSGTILLAQAFSKALGVEVGATTADRRFTLKLVHCVGACSIAPVVVAGKQSSGKVRVSKVPEIVKRLES